MLARLTALGLSALTLLVAACGGGEPTEPIRDYVLAIVDQDGGRACDQFSDELRNEVEGSAATVAGGRSCAEVMVLAAGLNPGLTESQVEELEIDVSTDGDEATATLVNPLVGREETIDLVKQGGEWLIDSLETRPQG